MSVRPSIRPSVSTEQLNSHWTNFHEFSYLSVFRKSVEKIQVALKPGKNNGYIYMKTYARLWKCPAEFLLEWEMFQAEVAQKIKTHFMFNKFFPQKS